MQQMSESNKYILFVGISIGCLSSLYFLSLLLPVPFFITVSLAVISFVFLFKWIVPGSLPSAEVPADNKWKSWTALLLVAVGVFCLSALAPAVGPKYGNWDAWAIWNLNAKYLADPVHWRKLFQNAAFGHPDYPVCLPATLAFFMRLTSSPANYMIPFAFDVLIALCIPILIFGELWRKNLAVAAVIWTLFVVENFYIIDSTMQYADVLLSFFFLCALVCINYADQNKKYLVLSVLFLGCCAWTKNEGAVLALLLLGFYAHRFFSKEHLRHTLITMLIPAFVIIVFKLICPTENDLLKESGTSTLGYILQKERYAAIFDFCADMLNKRLIYTRPAIVAYLIFCIAKRRLPGSKFLLVVTCVLAYFMVYVLTPKDLEWHLRTSSERLLLQLFPVLLYAMGSDIADMKFDVPKFRKPEHTIKK
jgi:hypothetical protein